MRMRLLIAALASAGLLLAGTAARAHHAFAAEFDVNKPLKIEGTLKKWDMVNPHSWFHIDVKGVEWLIEGGSPNQLIRMGVTKNTVKIGTKLVIAPKPTAANCLKKPRRSSPGDGVCWFM